MPYDAKKLWWPPFSRLHQHLLSRHAPSSGSQELQGGCRDHTLGPPAPSERQQTTISPSSQWVAEELSYAIGVLDEFGQILPKGLGWFGSPNSESKRILETDTNLAVGSKKLPIDPNLRKPAAEASQVLVKFQHLSNASLVRDRTGALQTDQSHFRTWLAAV